MRRLPLKVAVVLGLVALVGLIALSGARAATYVNGCPPFSDPVTDTQMQCTALAERLEVIVAELEAPEPVALNTGAIERLDLMWWGVWAAVGVGFVAILAPRWFAAFRVTRGV
jgi:hypothetical protein